MDNFTLRQMSVRQIEARTRAIDALTEAIAARPDAMQAASFAEVAVDAIIAAVTPDSEHAQAVSELLAPGTPDPRD